MVRLMKFPLLLLALAAAASAAPDLAKLPAPANRPVDFVKEIQPIFEATRAEYPAGKKR